MTFVDMKCTACHISGFAFDTILLGEIHSSKINQ